jgi:hypothetical protein
VTTPAQFIVSDDLSIPFEARRTVVPQFADASSGGIHCGSLTQDMIMQQADRTGAVVILWTNRFLDEFPILPRWLDVTYAGRKQFSEEHIIYYDKRTLQIAHPLNVTFGKMIGLEGYELSPATPPRLTLYWRRLSAESGDYKVSLRLLNTSGTLVAQRDDRPYGGHFPTTAWPVGVTLPEQAKLPSTDALPPGKYNVAIGLYDPAKPDLLPVAGGPGQNNLALLEELTLGSR